MSREAMQQALEALETVFMPHHPAVIALRERLAQPEPEPVAWIVESKHGNWAPYLEWSEPSYLETQVVTALYTAPLKREWVGLTDEQVEDGWERITGHGIFGGDRSEGRAMYISPDEVIEFSRAIEAKLKEKNA